MARIRAALTILVIFGQQRFCQGAAPIPSVTCFNGTYMKIDRDGWKTCEPCKRCPRGLQVVSECSKYDNTVCKPCTSGTFNDGTLQKCKPCTRCQSGQFMRKRCTKKRNSHCKSCPRRMYSRRSNSIYCSVCKTCKLYEEQVSPCSKRSNTVCGNCSVSYYRNKVTGECQPCSDCPPDRPWLIVEECFRKLGHTNTLCQAGLYFPFTTTENNNIIEYSVTDGFGLLQRDSFLITVIVLGVVLASTFLFVVSFVILQTYKCQWCIRRCRDLSVDTRCCESAETESPVRISRNAEHEFECIRVGNYESARKHTVKGNAPEKLNCSSDNGSFVIDESEARIQKKDEIFTFKTMESIVSSQSLPIDIIEINVEEPFNEEDMYMEDGNEKRHKRRRKNDVGTRNCIFSNPKYFPVEYYCTV